MKNKKGGSIMKKGKWFLCFKIKVRSFNSIGESMGEPVHTMREIKIRLYVPNNNETEATDIAKIFWSNKSFNSLPPEFRKGIKRDDILEFFNPKIIYKNVDFEKELVVP